MLLRPPQVQLAGPRGSQPWQMTSSSSQIYLCREVIAPCQPSDMIQFIEVDELGRLPLDATRSSLMLDILYIVVGTISW